MIVLRQSNLAVNPRVSSVMECAQSFDSLLVELYSPGAGKFYFANLTQYLPTEL